MERKIESRRHRIKHRPQNIRPLRRTLDLIISSSYRDDYTLMSEIDREYGEEIATRGIKPIDIRNYRGPISFFRKWVKKYLQY